MTADSSAGRIITFYSFKGGVGRTMALANVAFLASQNGYRVLVMDWDLEAPGLSYYFRGLLEGADLKQLKEAPGILNLIWDWRAALGSAKSHRQTEDLFNQYQAGAPFDKLVQPVFGDEEFPDGALDFIGAGSPVIDTPETLSYEDALARFSWHEFFEEYAGGSVLQYFREWAKQRYDFIFIDSRTGMADVAGICTMQIPDAVALCFVLNRQNIDGVAKVASAIRSNREDQVELRAMPMRIRAAGVGASLETDAQARAQLQLTKVGGFSSDALQEDIRLLAVYAALDLPYYETLAPFLADDPALDYLTLNYLRVANQLLGVELEIPNFGPLWLETVRRRLQPTHATVDYVLRLGGGEASRAVEELSRLIESAFEDEVDGADLDDDYVSALVETAIGLTDYSDSPYEALEMLNKAVDLLRDLTSQRPEKWKGLLVSALDRCLSELSSYLEPNEELALLEELDGLLAGNTTLNGRLRRVSNRRRAARIYANENELEAANQTIGELNKLIKDIKETSETVKMSPEQQAEVLSAEVEMSIIRGDVFQLQGNIEKCVREYNVGLNKLYSSPVNTRIEITRLQYDLHSRLARVSPEIVGTREAANHALRAVRAVNWSGGTNALVGQFVDLANAILQVDDPDLVLKFAEAVFGDERRGQVQFANYYGRHPRVAIGLLDVLSELSQRIKDIETPRVKNILRHMMTIGIFINSNLERRRHTISEKTRNEFLEHLNQLQGNIADSGVQLDFPLASPRQRRPRPNE